MDCFTTRLIYIPSQGPPVTVGIPSFRMNNTPTPSHRTYSISAPDQMTLPNDKAFLSRLGCPPLPQSRLRRHFWPNSGRLSLTLSVGTLYVPFSSNRIVKQSDGQALQTPNPEQAPQHRKAGIRDPGDRACARGDGLRSSCRVGREQFSSFNDLYLEAGPESGPGLLKRSLALFELSFVSSLKTFRRR